MANKTIAEVRQYVNLTIKENNMNEITGPQMNLILNDILDLLGKCCNGVVTLKANPGNTTGGTTSACSILTQASSSILAQANATGQMVLSLFP